MSFVLLSHPKTSKHASHFSRMNFFAALTCTIFAWGLAEGHKVFLRNFQSAEVSFHRTRRTHSYDRFGTNIRGCSGLSCTNKADGIHVLGWCTACSVGALLALASGKAERRQVHPLEDAPKNPFNPINPLLILRTLTICVHPKSVGEHRCLRYINNGFIGLNGFTCCVVFGLNGFVGGGNIPHNSLNCIF